MRSRLISLALVVLVSTVAAALKEGYTPQVTVTEPTRIDWAYTVATQSPAKPPTKFLPGDYDSSKQGYELFVPKRTDPKKPLPAVLFVSASDDPQGWKSFEKACRDGGFVFIGVRGAGNGVNGPRRCRTVLDCFDDVRRQLPLDPDRTYIAGFSGGGRIACAIGFALPDYFGGVFPIAASGDLRPEPWLRHRAIDRLSAALVTGTTDFNRGEVERWRGPFWTDIGIRTKVWTVEGGHTLPPPATVAAALKWLDDGRVTRADLAKKRPATRVDSSGAPTREESATALLAEGKDKLKAKETLHAGLMLLKGCLERWPDLPEAAEAKKVLLGYEGKGDWEKDDVAEQVKYMAAEAKALGDYVLKGIPPASQYAKQRPDMAKRVIEMWSLVIQTAPDSPAAKAGKTQLPELEKVAGKK